MKEKIYFKIIVNKTYLYIKLFKNQLNFCYSDLFNLSYLNYYKSYKNYKFNYKVLKYKYL